MYLKLPAEGKYLSLIRDFIREQAQAAKASPAPLESLIQAVDEAATNIVVHGYKEKPGTIEIEVSTTIETCCVILSDKAPAFDPTQAPQPDISLPLAERPVGGLGIHIIRHCVDEMKYCPVEGGGNQLVLIKYLHQNSI